MQVLGRGAGVAIVRDRGRFVGRVKRVGTAWQAWAQPTTPGPMIFIGWAPTRTAAVERLAA